MRKVTGAYPGERVLIGEIYLPVKRLVAYYGEDLDGVQLPFNFQLIAAEWRAETIARIIARYEAALPPGAWPNWVLSNHDRPRVASRLGEGQARVAAMLLLTLRGTPTLYYGIPPDKVQDPWEKNEPGLGLGRDPCRTPMPWDGRLPGAGFSTVEPWLPLNPDWRGHNVETLGEDPDSILNLYRGLLALRRGSMALKVGDYVPVSADDGVLVYERRAGAERVLVALNMTSEPRSLWLSDGTPWKLKLSTLMSNRITGDGDGLSLAPNEGWVAVTRTR
jgi:alpha-glucosidase